MTYKLKCGKLGQESEGPSKGQLSAGLACVKLQNLDFAF